MTEENRLDRKHVEEEIRRIVEKKAEKHGLPPRSARLRSAIDEWSRKAITGDAAGFVEIKAGIDPLQISCESTVGKDLCSLLRVMRIDRYFVCEDMLAQHFLPGDSARLWKYVSGTESASEFLLGGHWAEKTGLSRSRSRAKDNTRKAIKIVCAYFDYFEAFLYMLPKSVLKTVRIDTQEGIDFKKAVVLTLSVLLITRLVLMPAQMVRIDIPYLTDMAVQQSMYSFGTELLNLNYKTFAEKMPILMTSLLLHAQTVGESGLAFTSHLASYARAVRLPASMLPSWSGTIPHAVGGWSKAALLSMSRLLGWCLAGMMGFEGFRAAVQRFLPEIEMESVPRGL
jgi:hypothetical protein